MNLESKRDKDLDKSGSEDGDDSMDDMLNRVNIAIASRGCVRIKCLCEPPYSYPRWKVFQGHLHLGSQVELDLCPQDYGDCRWPLCQKNDLFNGPELDCIFNAMKSYKKLNIRREQPGNN